MSPNQDPIRLTHADLTSPKVQEFLDAEAALRRAMPEVTVQPLVVRIIYSSYFYLSIAGMLGALLGWAIFEPFINEGRDHDSEEFSWTVLLLVLVFPTIAALVGVFVGAAEGLVSRNPLRALLCAGVGLGIGFAGALIMIFPVGIVFSLMKEMALHISPPTEESRMPRGLGLLVLIMGRGTAWALAAIPAGLGQGIALREKKVVVNGLLGAVMGGLLGGLLFDPISLMLGSTETAMVSRGVGFAVIGIMVGLFVGLVEQWTKTAWILMRAGALAGKQFVLYRNPTVIGSSPKADIYVFKDPAIEPRHALIHNRGGRFEIEDCSTPDGTYVNGVAVTKQILKTGDQIVIGKTVLEFSLRDSK